MWKIPWKMWRVYALERGEKGIRAVEIGGYKRRKELEKQLISTHSCGVSTNFAWCCGGNVWETL